MEKDDTIGKTPSLDGPSGALKSAVGVNDLDYSTANNNQDDVDALPPSTLPKKRLFNSNNKRPSSASPSLHHSPIKGQLAKKKTRETKHRRSTRSTRAFNNITNNAKAARPSSPPDSPIKANNLNLRFQHSPIRTRSSKPKGGVKISTTVILKRLRPDTFGKNIASENVYDADDFAKHDAPFADAANNRFGHCKIALSKVKEGYSTNDFSNLSRLLLEDMLIQHNDDNEPALSFRVLISKPNASSGGQMSNNDAYLSAIQSQAKKIYWHQQRHGELGVQLRQIMGTKYHELYATLIPNETHKAIKEERLTMEEIEEHLNEEGGFDLCFEGDDSLSGVTMKIKWRDMIERPSDIMIFGPQSTTIRSFSSMFKDKSRLVYIHHIFRQLALEVRGDTEASLALMTAYQTKRATVSAENEETSREKTERSVIDAMSFLGVEQSSFFQRIDDTFKGAIETSIASFQVFNEPIVSKERMVEFMEEAQEKFPMVWRALVNMRGVNADTSRGSHLVEAKQMQVFFQLLSLARQADSHRLIYWAFVGALASYGWGIGKKPQNIACFWGNTCSTRSRDGIMEECGKDVQQRTTDILKKEKVVLLCYDNIQRGQPSKHQRAEQSSLFVTGTHQLSNKPVTYDNTEWDDKYAEMTCDQNQPIPSPSNCPAFEDIDTTSVDALVEVFTNFSSTECKTEPDMTGKRVEAYKSILKTRDTILLVKRVFSVSNVCQDSDVFDDTKIDSMHKIVRSKRAKPLLTGAKELQTKTVKCWNPSVGKATETLMLGVCGLPEESAKQCGAITLDQLVRVGILVENEDGTWKLADGWEDRRIYLYGDCKTIENIAKFVRDIANRSLSFDDTNSQVEVFIDAMTVVMTLPGDWHGGLAMLKSIYTLFYDGLLKPFQEALGWKRINKDVGGCYFQCVRLAAYVSTELMRAFMYEYASTHDDFSGDESSENDHATFICEFAIGFESFLEEMRSSDDEVRRVCALFLAMHNKFRTFVDSYRCGDAIAILIGYNSYLPIWQKLGQNKYVERVLAQNETLFRDFPFSRFMESNMNRCVRIHPESTGKRMVAQDEYLELKNALLAALPMIKKLESFIRQGQFLGLIERAKIFTAELYSLTSTTTISKTVEPTMIPEMQRIFEMIMKMGVNSLVNDRKYMSREMYQIVPTLTTDLAREKEKARTSCSDLHSYIRLYSSVDQMLPTQSRSAVENNGNNDEEENDDETDEDNVMASVRGEVAAEAEQQGSKDRPWMKQHADMTIDVEAVGWETINEKNWAKEREIALKRSQRHRQVNKEIADSVQEMRSGNIGRIGEERNDIDPQYSEWDSWCKSCLRSLRRESGRTDVLI